MRKAASGILVVAIVILWGAGSVTAEGKVITVAQEVLIPPGTSIELDPVSVGSFQHVSFLGRNDGPTATLSFAFTADQGKFSDAVPTLEGGECRLIAGRGVIDCVLIGTSGIGIRQSVFRVGGPSVAIRLTTPPGEVTPAIVTLMVFLSRP